MKKTRFIIAFCVLFVYSSMLFASNLPLVQAQSLKASPDKIYFGPSKTITVTFSGAPGNQNDWIGIFKGGAEARSYITYQYLKGQKSGTLTFNAPEEVGKYEFRMWEIEWTRQVAVSNQVSIEYPPAKLHPSVQKMNIGPGKKVAVSFENAPGYDNDWIGLFKVGAEAKGWVSYQYLKGKTKGSLEFVAPESPGSYEFRMWGREYTKHLSTSVPFTVQWGPVSMKVTVSSPDAQGKRKLTVQYSGAPGYDNDWIGLFYAGAAEKSWVSYQYLKGKTTGTLEFACPDDTKSYEFRMWGREYTQFLAKTQTFIPKNGPPPPVDQGPTDPSPPPPPPPPPPPDPPPPAPDKPFTLRAYPGDGKVFLEWTPPQNTSKVIGYNLYRKTSRIPYGSPITDFPIKGLNHTDMNVDNGMQACYYMKAVYNDKTESAASNEVCVTPGAGADGKITIVLTIGSKNAYVNQQLVVLDVAPFIDSGRTFVPFRFVGESLGAEVGYTTDASGRVATVTYKLGSTSIILYIGRKDALVNGRTVYLDVAPKIVQGRTVIPLRFVTEALGCKVDWDGQAMKVTITYPA